MKHHTVGRMAGLAAVAGLLALAGAGPAAAQGVARRAAGPAWLGLSYEVQWLARGETCEPRVVVESVIQGAPADRAGLRPGDALLAVDGSALGGTRLQLLASRLSVGDSVRLTVARAGRMREVVAVAGRRPERPPVVLRSRTTLASSDAPIVRLHADTLVVLNAERHEARGRMGYWLARENGRTEFRRVGRFSADPLDRRVQELLVCAERSQASAPIPPAVRHLSVAEVQERADSVREIWVRRALERPEGEPRPGVVWVPAPGQAAPAAVGAIGAAPLPPAPPEPTEPGAAPPRVGFYAFSVGDHLAAAERGVAGAEVTRLEPELAEYFRGARQGLLVLRVAPGTPAARAGLRPGDVITDGGGRRLADVADLRRLLSLPDAAPLELRVVRQGRTRTLTLARE